ncbi:MAG: flagellar biosynthesis protein FlhB [Pirellulaceae bacterium]
MADNQDKDQKTEQATPQKLQKARSEGQIGFSSELIAGVMMTCGVMVTFLFGASFFGFFGDAIKFRFTHFEEVIQDPRLLVRAMIEDTQLVGAACLGLIGPLAAVAGLAGLMQTGFNISSKPLQFDVSKMSVIKGFGRIFSGKSAIRGVLSVAKAVVIVAIVYFVTQSRIEEIALLGFGSFHEMIFALGELVLFAAACIAAMMLIVGVIDLGYQKWKHLQDMQMSVKDIKDEQKESDGDPQMRARMRKLQSELSRKRMLDDVPKANVVITNPTHFAVALKYDPAESDAPIVIAKGGDHLARKIIEIAKENGVAVVERKPLARFLFANCEVEQMIPLEMYQAVAEVLNFVSRLRDRI